MSVTEYYLILSAVLGVPLLFYLFWIKRENKKARKEKH